METQKIQYYPPPLHLVLVLFPSPSLFPLCFLVLFSRNCVCSLKEGLSAKPPCSERLSENLLAKTLIEHPPHLAVSSPTAIVRHIELIIIWVLVLMYAASIVPLLIATGVIRFPSVVVLSGLPVRDVFYFFGLEQLHRQCNTYGKGGKEFAFVSLKIFVAAASVSFGCCGFVVAGKFLPRSMAKCCFLLNPLRWWLGKLSIVHDFEYRFRSP